jgi:hypothetical protein
VSASETLRETAALMRSRAKAATDGGHGWRPTGEVSMCEVWAPRDAANHDAFMVASTLTRLNPNPSAQAQADAEHIAGMDPLVALAFANWLDTAADWRDANPEDAAEAAADPDPEIGDPALAVAHAYLGTSPDPPP